MKRLAIFLMILPLLALGCGGNNAPQTDASDSSTAAGDTSTPGPDSTSADTTPGQDLSAVADQSSATDQATPQSDSSDDVVASTDQSSTKPIDYVIISADDLLETANAFSSYRAERGYTTVVHSVSEIMGGNAEYKNEDAVLAIKAKIQSYYALRDANRPFYVLIVGAADYRTGIKTAVPIGFQLTGHVDPDTYSDNRYADMDGDDIPDLAIGRITVRSNADGAAVLQKIKTHEGSYQVGEWNRRVAVYTGEGGFGVEIDSMLETVGRLVLEDVPYDLDVSFAYNKPSSVYYYAPFYDKVVDLLTAGAVIAVFVGHGGGELNVNSLEQIQVKTRFPVLAFFACATGSIVGTKETELEHLVRMPNAPMAALVSYVDSHPYGNAIMARELQSVLLKQRVKTYGEAVRIMKQRSLVAEQGDSLRALIDSFTKTQISEEEMALIRRSHLYIYHLIGDPALETRFPEGSVALSAETTVKAGQTLSFSGTVTGVNNGQVKLTLVVTRSTVPDDLANVSNPKDPASWPTVQANYEKVMQRTVETGTATLQNGSFSGSLVIPASLVPGTYYLKAIADDGSRDAIGVLKLTLVQ